MEIALNIRGTRVYKQCIQYLSPEEAYRQLLIVMIRKITLGYTNNVSALDESLEDSFCWEETPQGRSFWSNVNRHTES